MSERLKPCPFCGGKAKLRAFALHFGAEMPYAFYVGCDDCEASSNHYDYRKEAIEAWNRRVIE